MHETSIAQNIVDIVNATMENHPGNRVKGINLRIGPMAGVDPGSLEFAFQIVAKDTVCQDAVLSIETTVIQAECLDCHQSFAPEAFEYACPACQSARLRLVAGNELNIVDLEVEPRCAT